MKSLMVLRRCIAGMALGLAAASLPSIAGAVTPTVSQTQSIDLGGTTFYDGFGGDGLTYIGYLRQTFGNAIKDGNGSNVPVFKSPKVDATIFINQFVYQFASPTFLGAHPGLDLLIPVVGFHSSFGQDGASLAQNGAGLGDITVGTFLQFDPLIVDGHPVWVNRVEFAALLPTGRYDATKDINSGSHYYSLNPSWASTFLFAPKWELSWRLNYIYNFKNSNPSGSAPLDLNGATVTSTKAGHAAWLNFALSYAVSPRWEVGVNGYYLKQLSNDSINGISQPNTKEQVLGIGPGVLFKPTKSTFLFASLYTEAAVENRVRNGVIAQLHWVHTFGNN
nr:transporter [Burkholderia ambifaria]